MIKKTHASLQRKLPDRKNKINPKTTSAKIKININTDVENFLASSDMYKEMINIYLNFWH